MSLHAAWTWKIRLLNILFIRTLLHSSYDIIITHKLSRYLQNNTGECLGLQNVTENFDKWLKFLRFFSSGFPRNLKTWGALQNKIKKLGKEKKGEEIERRRRRRKKQREGKDGGTGGKKEIRRKGQRERKLTKKRRKKKGRKKKKTSQS